MMPRLDGYQTCALIKKNAKFHDTPGDHAVVEGRACSTGARGRMVGSDQYLTKPFTKESLLKAVAATTARSGGMTSPETATMTIRKILIVDDSPTERHVLNDMLTKAGYEVVASDNGEDADPQGEAV